MDRKISKLKKYFQKRNDVSLAFLFGSHAKGFEMKESDFDVAVYLKNAGKEDEIWSDVSHIVKEKEVDLVSLNEAPATLISEVFQTGIPLVIKDKRLYWELYLEKSLESEDFLEFIKDFWRIKEKAQSLSREAETRLRIRFDYLKDEYKGLERFKSFSQRDYIENKDKRKLIERWTENILNATLDIAKIVLASEKQEMSRSYEDALFDFAFFVGFDVEESKEFSRFAQLRNILAHEYLDILYGRIQNFISKTPKFYYKIFSFLNKYLKVDK